jgi:hypothetical protein
MKKIVVSVIVSFLLAGATPTFAAKSDCDAGYKDFITKMSPYVDNVSSDELAGYVRKALGAYDSCTAGDSSITPHGVWDEILADMQAKKKN